MIIAILLSSQALFAQGWGTITGKIVVVGDPPKLPDLVTKGVPVPAAPGCAKHTIPDEKLVVGEKGGLVNCFVYLYQRRGTPDIHPDLIKPAQEKVVFNQKGCRFIPHALVVRTDQKVNCINNDNWEHNIHTFPLRNGGSNRLISTNPGKNFDLEFAKSEPLPIQVKCDIHPWMSARWLIVDHPYAVVSDKEGRFKIEKIPAGEHTFRIWHEIPGYIRPNGERNIVLSIEEGKTIDLGEIKISAEELK